MAVSRDGPELRVEATGRRETLRRGTQPNVVPDVSTEMFEMFVINKHDETSKGSFTCCIFVLRNP